MQEAQLRLSELFPFNTCAAGARATIPCKSTVLSKQAQRHLSTENNVLIHWSHFED